MRGSARPSQRGWRRPGGSIDWPDFTSPAQRPGASCTMPLKDLPLDARPREKLLALGPAALADVELLALLLRTGLPGVSVLQLAQRLLEAHGGVRGLLQAEASSLRGIAGLGPA